MNDRRGCARIGWSAWAAALALACAGCSLFETRDDGAGVINAPNAPRESSPAFFRGERSNDGGDRLSRQREALRRCLPGDDLAEDLYYGWMLEPYHRASLAIAVKTIDVLAREEQLRQQGRDTLSPERVAAMHAWLDRLFDHAWAPIAPGFQPDRLSAARSASELTAMTQTSFTFADRATFTARSRAVGDLDLLAAAGFRWYVWDGVSAATAAGAVRQSRAEALGCTPALAPARFPGERSAPAGTMELAFQPLTLAQLFDGQISGSGIPAVIDLPEGEDLVGMIARRQLLRGVTSGPPLAAIGQDGASGSTEDAAASVRAAMWLQALAGQRIGVFEGWRDMRDGTQTPYPSRLSQPEYLEAVAHTALDLRRFADGLAACRTAVRVGLALPADLMLARDPNRWSLAAGALLAELQAAGEAIDLVPAGRTDLLARYSLGIEVAWTDGRPGTSIDASTQGGRTVVTFSCGAQDIHMAREAGAFIARLIDPALPPAAARQQGSGGYAASPIVRRASADGRVCILVNCAATRQVVQWGDDTPGGRAGGTWTDRLTGESCGREIPLQPWQVRLLVR